MTLPPADGQLDYQLGGAYPPPTGVQVLSRDRLEAPASGLYNICYVNGFQAQPDDDDWWLTQHPDLVLRDGDGEPVIDPDWNEMLLDVGTAPKRSALATIVGGWIDQCGTDGFDAVEIDNLDSYSRSQGLLTQENAVAFMKLLSDAAHARGLAIAQKNSTELLPRRADMGTDFVVAEECNRYSECGDYVTEYGNLVFVIEYRQQDFDAGCTNYPNLSIVLRDLNLTMPSSGSYVYDAC
ncbi:MAG: endo alpha-1,4 polygalactosaminidase [Deltaproteobacteria bacterium]|nr:endo alpha-1,4 polygalactosaminidase [Deltaproteobacteria bacterium]MBW2535450.1 endo alpha-1,4 polygalactosaminidase [Deltaproteobacteria bacterium]